MHHQQPKRTAALVLSGTGYNPGREFTKHRIASYKEHGIGYRWGYTFEDLSPAFRATPMAHFFADMFTERNAHADVQSIIYQFEALAQAGSRTTIHSRIACPAIILTGSEDGSHPRAAALKARIPGCEMKILLRRRPCLPDRAALAVRSLHARVSQEARPVSVSRVIALTELRRVCGTVFALSTAGSELQFQSRQEDTP